MSCPYIFNAIDFVCPYCGASNPDGGDKCGNCEKNPYLLPQDDEQLTAEELNVLYAARHCS